jgi:hypothetical protein
MMYQKLEQAAVFDDGFELVCVRRFAMSEDDRVADPAEDPKDVSRAYRLHHVS